MFSSPYFTWHLTTEITAKTHPYNATGMILVGHCENNWSYCFQKNIKSWHWESSSFNKNFIFFFLFFLLFFYFLFYFLFYFFIFIFFLFFSPHFLWKYFGILFNRWIPWEIITFDVTIYYETQYQNNCHHQSVP